MLVVQLLEAVYCSCIYTCTSTHYKCDCVYMYMYVHVSEYVVIRLLVFCCEGTGSASVCQLLPYVESHSHLHTQWALYGLGWHT